MSFVYRISYIVFQHGLRQKSCPGERCVTIVDDLRQGVFMKAIICFIYIFIYT